MSLMPDIFLDTSPSATAVTVGVFDGVHVGHQAVLRRLVETAGSGDMVPWVVTFASHPERVLNPVQPQVYMLTSLEHRTGLLRKYGAQGITVLEFDSGWACMPASDFLRILADRLACRTLVLGEDARIGKGGMPLRALRDPAARLGISLHEVPGVSVAGERVSSTRIRSLLHTTRLDDIKPLLGRRFSSYGQVIRGRQRGHELGFPTLNIDVSREVRPPLGVYAGWVVVEGCGIYTAVTNIGDRPTFDKPADDPIIETHALGVALPPLYDKHAEFIYDTKLRDERLFCSPEALRDQIAHDVKEAARILSEEDEPCTEDYLP